MPFFFKQWGAWAPFEDSVDRYYPGGRPGIGEGNREYNRALNKMIRHHGGSVLIDDRPEGWEPYMIRDGMGILGGGPHRFMLRVGKKAAGRLMDGRTHDEFPQTQTQEVSR